MTRVLARAAIVALIAGLIVAQLEGSTLLWAWELLLVALLVLQLREIPGEETAAATPLLSMPVKVVPRLPRSVLSAEVATSDALSGQLGRDRRLRPILARIANHRLGRHGTTLEQPGALEFLEDVERDWLLGRGDRPLRPADLRRLVARLETL